MIWSWFCPYFTIIMQLFGHDYDILTTWLWTYLFILSFSHYSALMSWLGTYLIVIMSIFGDVVIILSLFGHYYAVIWSWLRHFYDMIINLFGYLVVLRLFSIDVLIRNLPHHYYVILFKFGHSYVLIWPLPWSRHYYNFIWPTLLSDLIIWPASWVEPCACSESIAQHGDCKHSWAVNLEVLVCLATPACNRLSKRRLALIDH